jgi:hypothetical protein
MHDLLGEGRRAGNDVAQGGQIVVLERKCQQHLQHGRHDRRDLHLVLLDELQEVRGIEPPLQHGDTRLHRVQADRRHEKPVGMRQR